MDEQRDWLILIVEDDEATKGFLADNLAADGFRVASASTAAEGLRAIEVRRPSLVLLDLRLEGGTGLDVLDRVRAADGLATRIDPDLPVIVLTGRAAEADRVRSFQRGADDHVSKPFLYAELLGRVRAVLRRAEGRRGQGVLRVRDLTIDPSTRTESRSCCATSGVTSPPATRGHWTHTPAGCARSSAIPAGPGC